MLHHVAFQVFCTTATLNGYLTALIILLRAEIGISGFCHGVDHYYYYYVTFSQMIPNEKVRDTLDSRPWNT